MKFKKLFILLFTLFFILQTCVCSAMSDEPNISAEAAILIDSSSEKIIY